ncbi:helicase associated domain-containing protein [Streptomyces rubiginosohelvolus]|uniref:helicase associated domain-containing protein n=1 Tax=Streptomyces rubiginosohelvolus TaxID=67362 RepID=UPI003718E012
MIVHQRAVEAGFVVAEAGGGDQRGGPVDAVQENPDAHLGAEHHADQAEGGERHHARGWVGEHGHARVPSETTVKLSDCGTYALGSRVAEQLRAFKAGTLKPSGWTC